MTVPSRATTPAGAQRPDRPAVLVVGGFGTTGLQLTARLAESPERYEVVDVDADRRKDLDHLAALAVDADLSVLCLPDAAAREFVERVGFTGARMLDASSAHRVSEGWVYGLPELSAGHSQTIAGARRASNPGCYPTGFILLTRPLIDRGLLAPDASLVVAAVSGYSGGGRADVDLYESDGPPPPVWTRYAMGARHKHLPEMIAYSGVDVAPVFLPSRAAYRQGIFMEVPLTRDSGLSPADAHDIVAAYHDAYGACERIRVPGGPELRWGGASDFSPEVCAGWDDIELGIIVNEAFGQISLVAVYDNLGKGAAGAAMDNVRLMLQS